MNLWLLRPITDHPLWDPWHDKVFGHVVRAEDEDSAREFAANNCRDEGWQVWLYSDTSTCVELSPEGEPEHIIQDAASHRLRIEFEEDPDDAIDS